MLSNIRIVLVRTIRAGNLGAATRAMMNMGLSELVLVSPECRPDDEQAQGFATRAKPLLNSARIVDSVPAALDGCIATFATSAKGGFYRRQSALPPDEAARQALEFAARGPVAVVFGPEDRGLLQHELLLFDRLIEIPADPAYPALNLAAAAMVVCYELRRASLAAAHVPQLPPASDPPAPDERKRVLYDKLFAALERIGFFGGQQSPDHLRHALRRIFGRRDLTINEVDILIGVSQQIQWYAARAEKQDH